MNLMQVGRVAGAPNHGTGIGTRRVLDVVIAIIGLALLAPVMMLVCIAIWLDSGGPIFFSQVRLGQSGKGFRIYKFRKFHRESGATGCGVTIKDDRRMTRLGRFLTRTKLDELPQLWNVIKGDMTIVGPRPESAIFKDCVTCEYLSVLEHKPGIFGPNQCYFRNEGALYPEGADPERFYREVLFPLKARIDFAYFSHRTTWTDIGWVIRGLLAVCGVQSAAINPHAVLGGWLEPHNRYERAHRAESMNTGACRTNGRTRE